MLSKELKRIANDMNRKPQRVRAAQPQSFEGAMEMAMSAINSAEAEWERETGNLPGGVLTREGKEVRELFSQCIQNLSRIYTLVP